MAVAAAPEPAPAALPSLPAAEAAVVAAAVPGGGAVAPSTPAPGRLEAPVARRSEGENWRRGEAATESARRATRMVGAGVEEEGCWSEEEGAEDSEEAREEEERVKTRDPGEARKPGEKKGGL